MYVVCVSLEKWLFWFFIDGLCFGKNQMCQLWVGCLLIIQNVRLCNEPANLPVPSGGFAKCVGFERTSPFRPARMTRSGGSGGFAEGWDRWHG